MVVAHIILMITGPMVSVYRHISWLLIGQSAADWKWCQVLLIGHHLAYISQGSVIGFCVSHIFSGELHLLVDYEAAHLPCQDPGGLVQLLGGY